MSRALSPAQQYTLKIYRGMLRQAPRFGPDIKAQIRDGFRQNKSVKSILQQEYLVRQAEKKLALMKLDTTTGYNPPSK